MKNNPSTTFGLLQALMEGIEPPRQFLGGTVPSFGTSMCTGIHTALLPCDRLKCRLPLACTLQESNLFVSSVSWKRCPTLLSVQCSCLKPQNGS